MLLKSCNILFLVLFLFNSSFSQNSTTYPYGGKQDKSGKYIGFKNHPLVFNNKSIFVSTRFDSIADFSFAKFKGIASFNSAHFNKKAVFFSAQFKKEARFNNAKFYNFANFERTWFNETTNFSFSQFYNVANFVQAKLTYHPSFMSTIFHGKTHFSKASFAFETIFNNAKFYDNVYFDKSEFNNFTSFYFVQFHKLANFRNAKFNANIEFSDTKFYNIVDFRSAKINGIIFFSFTAFHGDIKVGSNLKKQNFDFRRSLFLTSGSGMTTIPEDSSLGIQPKEIKYSGAKIIIYAPVTLEMQPEKTKFITLYDSLDYFTKADIISTLKNVSFKGEPYKRSRYELDFLYEKSTMYQKQKIVYEEYSKYHPITWWRSLYFITMGLGYRPFWLLYWALGLIITFTMWYFISMKKQIKNYLYKDEKGQVSKYQRYRIQNQSKKDHWLDILINCFYFSTMLFFTFRLKKDILISFSKGKRWLIVTEWSLGFLMYVAFLTLSKSGSILHTIKSLFVV